jgi:Leucine-rich repeat (LRR) protein
MYLQAQPLRSVSRRVTKEDELILEPGALAPGAYRAGNASECDVEDESMTHSDRLLNRSEPERHTEDVEALGELREEQVQFGDGLQPQSFATSYSHQLGLDIDQPPEYGQEQAQQSVDIKTGRSCRLGLIIAVAVLVIAAVGLGLAFGLNNGSDEKPAGTTSVDDNPNCIYALDLTDQCESDGSVSNIPSCVRQRYNYFEQELGLSIGGSLGDCSAENLALLSMVASNQPIYMSNYALSVFFYSTGGPSWSQKGGWATTSSVCSWYGVTCELVCKLDGNGVQSCAEDPEQITILNLDQNRVSGSLPTSIGLLSNLQNLQMIVNELQGTLPSEIGSLSSLLSFNLARNLGISGTIPTTIGSLKELRLFSLKDAELAGTIPTQIGTMSNLDVFDVGYNRLNGPIPSEMGNLLNLQVVYIDGNGLTGQIPSAVQNCVKLQTFTIKKNAFSGTIPSELGLLKNLGTFLLNVALLPLL